MAQAVGLAASVQLTAVNTPELTPWYSSSLPTLDITLMLLLFKTKSEK